MKPGPMTFQIALVTYKNMLPSRFEIHISFWNGYRRCVPQRSHHSGGARFLDRDFTPCGIKIVDPRSLAIGTAGFEEAYSPCSRDDVATGVPRESFHEFGRKAYGAMTVD